MDKNGSGSGSGVPGEDGGLDPGGVNGGGSLSESPSSLKDGVVSGGWSADVLMSTVRGKSLLYFELNAKASQNIIM